MPTYPPAPAPRIAYDRNGTAVFYHDGTHAPTPLTPSQIVGLNDESDANGLVLPLNINYLGFVFPQLRDIAAFGGRFGVSTTATYTLETSNNSTDGLNGTWTTVTQPILNNNFDPAAPAFRTSFTAQSVPSVQAIRFNITGLSTSSTGPATTAYGVHLYGAISTGQTLDRLAFVDMFDNPLTGGAFDQGDIAQSSSKDTPFQVMNASPTRTATNVAVFLEALTDATPSVPAQYLLSLDGQNFYGSVTIASLTPNQAVPVTLRRVTPANAVVGVWAPRVVARAGAWQ